MKYVNELKNLLGTLISKSHRSIRTLIIKYCMYLKGKIQTTVSCHESLKNIPAIGRNSVEYGALFSNFQSIPSSIAYRIHSVHTTLTLFH